MVARPNLLDPEVQQNPFPLYARLRREAPVSQVEPGGLWSLARHDDVVAALKAPHVFSSKGLRLNFELSWLNQINPLVHSMIMVDPPQHTRLRGLVQRAFGIPLLNRLEPRIRQVARSRVDVLLEQRPKDIVQEFSLPVPCFVACELLGLDSSLQSRFLTWAGDLVGGSAIPPEDTERQAEARHSLEEMKHYLEEVVNSRRHAPREDLVSELLSARLDGELLSHDELMGFLSLLLVASLETTMNLLSHSVLALAEHPQVLARLRAHPEQIPRFIEEVLRCYPVAPATMRMTTQEVQVCGVRIPQGQAVILLVASALRDEKYYPSPECFDMDREGTATHLAFGYGIHYCVGASLAKLEVKVALEELLTRCEGFELAAPVRWQSALLIRGPTVLLMKIHPAQA